MNTLILIPFTILSENILILTFWLILVSFNSFTIRLFSRYCSFLINTDWFSGYSVQYFKRLLLRLLWKKTFFRTSAVVKNIFHSLWRAIIWWKNKNLIKNSGHNLKMLMSSEQDYLHQILLNKAFLWLFQTYIRVFKWKW